MLQEILAFFGSLPDKLKFVVFPIFTSSLSVFCWNWDWVLSFTHVSENLEYFAISAALFIPFALAFPLQLGFVHLIKYLKCVYQARKNAKSKKDLLAESVSVLKSLNRREKEVLFECLSNKEQTFYRNYDDWGAMSLVHKKILLAAPASSATTAFTFRKNIWEYLMEHREQWLASLSEEGITFPTKPATWAGR